MWKVPQISFKFSKSHLQFYNKKNLYKSCETLGYRLCVKTTETPNTTSWFIYPDGETHRGKTATQQKQQCVSTRLFLAFWLPMGMALATSSQSCEDSWMNSRLATAFIPVVTSLWKALQRAYPVPILPSALTTDHWSITGPEEKHFPDFLMDRDGYVSEFQPIRSKSWWMWLLGKLLTGLKADSSSRLPSARSQCLLSWNAEVMRELQEPTRGHQVTLEWKPYARGTSAQRPLMTPEHCPASTALPTTNVCKENKTLSLLKPIFNYLLPNNSPSVKNLH